MENTMDGAFRFYTRLHLSELTGLKAEDLKGLVSGVKSVSGSCIYHHTHRFLQQHQYLCPEPPNDFAYWVSSVLGDDELAERLASIDTIQFPTIKALREEMVSIIESHLEKNPKAVERSSLAGQEFHFIKSKSFVLPTDHVAHDLREFVEILDKISAHSIYFHMFESRLRLENGNNDFSKWLATYAKQEKLAEEISRLDPYTYTMEGLRKELIRIIKKRTEKTWIKWMNICP